MHLKVGHDGLRLLGEVLELGVRVALEEHADALTSGGAGGDDAVLAVFADEAVSCVHGQANSGGSCKRCCKQG